MAYRSYMLSMGAPAMQFDTLSGRFGVPFGVDLSLCGVPLKSNFDWRWGDQSGNRSASSMRARSGIGSFPCRLRFHGIDIDQSSLFILNLLSGWVLVFIRPSIPPPTPPASSVQTNKPIDYQPRNRPTNPSTMSQPTNRLLTNQPINQLSKQISHRIDQ